VAELTERPERIGGPVPQVPKAVLRNHVSGEVVLQFIIDTTGHVEKGTVSIISAPDSDFAASARQTTLVSVFKPGRTFGKPVRTKIRQSIRYDAR